MTGGFRLSRHYPGRFAEAVVAIALLAACGESSDPPKIGAGTEFTCTPTQVWDGDGPVWCREGPVVRLAAIAAREIDGTCRPGHPCPAADGIAARDRLVALVGQPTGTGREGHVFVRAAPMRCRSDGSADGVRTAAWCVTRSGVDLSCAMVASGHALPWQRHWRGHRCPD